jgi:hypothetical protein
MREKGKLLETLHLIGGYIFRYEGSQALSARLSGKGMFKIKVNRSGLENGER